MNKSKYNRLDKLRELRIKQKEAGLCSVPYCLNEPEKNKKLCIVHIFRAKIPKEPKTQYPKMFEKQFVVRENKELVTKEQYNIVDAMKREKKLLGEIFYKLGDLSLPQRTIISNYYYGK